MLSRASPLRSLRSSRGRVIPQSLCWAAGGHVHRSLAPDLRFHDVRRERRKQSSVRLPYVNMTLSTKDSGPFPAGQSRPCSPPTPFEQHQAQPSRGTAVLHVPSTSSSGYSWSRIQVPATKVSLPESRDHVPPPQPLGIPEQHSPPGSDMEAWKRGVGHQCVIYLEFCLGV